MRVCAAFALLGLAAGCGTTRSSDTLRTATEQLLLSNAIDQAVARIDFRVLAGKSVYFDDQYLEGVVDRNYVVSTIRQHLLASGAFLRHTREEADYIVEARAGAVGTDRNELLFGVPAVNIPSVPGAPVGVPSSIPEIALAKKTDQRAVAKIVVFAYNRKTGRPLWQSGINPTFSTAEDTWFFGAGPFQRGSIHDGTKFAGADIDAFIAGNSDSENKGSTRVPLTAEMRFPQPNDTPQASAGNRGAMLRLPPLDSEGRGLVFDPLDTRLRQARRDTPSAGQANGATGFGPLGDDSNASKPKRRRGILNMPSVRKLFGRGDEPDEAAR